MAVTFGFFTNSTSERRGTSGGVLFSPSADEFKEVVESSIDKNSITNLKEKFSIARHLLFYFFIILL